MKNIYFENNMMNYNNIRRFKKLFAIFIYKIFILIMKFNK